MERTYRKSKKSKNKRWIKKQDSFLLDKDNINTKHKYNSKYNKRYKKRVSGKRLYDEFKQDEFDA